ncbi:hypothetical protein INR49_000695 [Caranx melampygus]|nr:hypothetical protein INR49_000695 [Caranx melampygus]
MVVMMMVMVMMIPQTDRNSHEIRSVGKCQKSSEAGLVLVGSLVRAEAHGPRLFQWRDVGLLTLKPLHKKKKKKQKLPQEAQVGPCARPGRPHRCQRLHPAATRHSHDVGHHQGHAAGHSCHAESIEIQNWRLEPSSRLPRNQSVSTLTVSYANKPSHLAILAKLKLEPENAAWLFTLIVFHAPGNESAEVNPASGALEENLRRSCRAAPPPSRTSATLEPAQDEPCGGDSTVLRLGEMALLLLQQRGGRFLRRSHTSRAVAAIMSLQASAPCSSVTSGRQQVNGVDLYYEQLGRGKHAVLLLPGALGSTRTDFGPQLKSLNEERFTVVGWDPRGYGQSRPPDRDFPPDFFERDAKDAVDLMKALGFGKFSLLGWSDGGITALIAAARNPDLINRMVVWGSNAFVSQQDLKLYDAVRDVSRWSARMRQPMEEVYGAEVFATTWEGWVDGIAQFAKRPEGSICMELLPLITCPTLIVHGEKDPMVPSFHPQYLLKHIKGSRLHLMPEGKHNLHLRYADEFNKLVEDFLEG